jgi:hypothetical protein
MTVINLKLPNFSAYFINEENRVTEFNVTLDQDLAIRCVIEQVYVAEKYFKYGFYNSNVNQISFNTRILKYYSNYRKTMPNRVVCVPFKRRVKSHLLALLGAHHIFHVSRVRVKYRRVPSSTPVTCNLHFLFYTDMNRFRINNITGNDTVKHKNVCALYPKGLGPK